MKRLLFCLVALIAVMALVVPTYAAEMKIKGINRIKFISYENMDGTDDEDDNNNFVKQRFRMYFSGVASENLKVVYKNEIDFYWGDEAKGVRRNEGGGLGGDTVNLETKNVYLEFMVPDTPMKATLGLQGLALHRGWFIDDDISAARFDLNFDPVSVLAWWAIAQDNDFTNSSDDVWQLAASVAYKAEIMDARVSLAYERGADDGSGDAVDTDVKDDDFFILMGELNMSFDLVSFFVIGGLNFGEVDGGARDRDYEGYLVHAGADFALDLATISVQFIYASGDDENLVDTDGDPTTAPVQVNDEDFRGLSGECFSWAEIPSDGYFWEANSDMPQIGGENTPNNLIAVNVGADMKPTDTTTLTMDLWYLTMVEDRTVGGSKEDEIGWELDASLTQKIYDNLEAKIVAAYLLADNGFGEPTGENPSTLDKANGDDAYVIGLGFNFKF